MKVFLLTWIENLTDPHKLIALITSVFSGGWAYLGIFLILFSETGLLIGFFLPGDSLLFALGVIAGAGGLNIFLMILVLFIAAVIGDTSGFFLGRSLGVRAFNKPNSIIFNQRHLNRTKEFYDKHGGKTIIFARFVPIIRTFAPFVSGVAEMPYRKFIVFSIIGSLGWVGLLTTAGYFLGNVKFVQDNFEKAIIFIIVLSLIPPVIEALKERRRNKNRQIA